MVARRLRRPLCASIKRKIMDPFEEFEIDDYDAELLNRGDYDSVLQLRKNQLKKYPKDYLTRYRWAEILVLTKRYDDAISTLSGLHKEDSEDEDVIDLILDYLRETNQKHEDYKWEGKPIIITLNEQLLNDIKRIIKGKRGDKRKINSIYIDLFLGEGHLFFEEQDLFEYLKQSERVQIMGDEWYDARIERIN